MKWIYNVFIVKVIGKLEWPLLAQYRPPHSLQVKQVFLDFPATFAFRLRKKRNFHLHLYQHTWQYGLVWPIFIFIQQSFSFYLKKSFSTFCNSIIQLFGNSNTKFKFFCTFNWNAVLFLCSCWMYFSIKHVTAIFISFDWVSIPLMMDFQAIATGFFEAPIWIDK